MTLRARCSPTVCAVVATAALVPGHRVQAFAPAPADLVVLDAKLYTADAARGMDESLAVRAGTIASVIVVHQDILALADPGRGEDIAAPQVLKTWFVRRPVFEREPP